MGTDAICGLAMTEGRVNCTVMRGNRSRQVCDDHASFRSAVWLPSSTMAALVLLAGCDPGETTTDTGQFDSCAADIATEADTELLFHVTDYTPLPYHEFVVLRDQVELDAAWNTYGIPEPKPAVDFAVSQVVMWQRTSGSCLAEEWIPRNFHRRRDGESGLVLTFEAIPNRQGECWSCDSTDRELDAWATPVDDVTRCGFGERCVATEP